MVDALAVVAAVCSDQPYLIGVDVPRRVTFGELQTSARRIAGGFRSLGLQTGDRVAICLDNGPALVEWLFGAFLGGLIAVPIPPGAGPSTITHSLIHSGARLVLAPPDLVADLSARVPPTVRFLADSSVDPWEVVRNGSDSPEPLDFPLPGPNQDALLIYTSGSTGVPKGVVLTHANLVAAGRNASAAHALSPADCSLCVLPLGHLNALTVTLLPSLVAGASVVLPRRFDVHRFWTRMEEHQCTWSALVPTLIAQLLDTPERSDAPQIRPGRQIRFIRSSSAPLAAERKAAFELRFGLPVIEAMGSTEAGGAIFATPLPPRPNKPRSPGVAWGFETRFVGPDGRDVSAGEPGELLLRGPSIMRGYFRDSAATAAVLSPDGWLRTGDLGRLDADGYLFLSGRTREVINKGGTKIPPREVEEILLSHASVLEAAVVAMPDAAWGEDLAAFVVARPGVPVAESDLLDWCSARLGFLRRPAWVRFLPELPKGPAGKVLRQQLAEAARTASVSQPGPMSSRDPVQILTELWRQVLRTDQVGITDNFFALGGHSLPAMQVLAGLRREAGTGLTLADFLRHPTIEAQARLLAASSGPIQSTDSEARPARHPGTPWPLSPAQTGIWFETQLRPESCDYHELEAVRLRGPLHPSALVGALQEVVRRHEILRARVDLQGAVLVQVPSASGVPRVQTEDLGSLAPDRRAAEAAHALGRWARRPFDLEREPGFRVLLIRMGPDDHILGVVIHHLICDRTSIGILARDLSLAYREVLEGRIPAWSGQSWTFGDVALDQNRRLAGPDGARDLDFWRRVLDGLPPFKDFPSPGMVPTTDTGQPDADRVHHALGPGRSRRIRETAGRNGVSPFTILLATFQRLVARETGNDDFVIGVPVASRDRPEWRELLGLLVDFLPLRVRLTPSEGVPELLQRTHRDLLELMQHRAVSMMQIAGVVGRRDGMASAPLCRLAVNWRHHSSELQSVELHGIESGPFPVHAGGCKFDLVLAVVDRDEFLELEVDFACHQFSRDTVERWLREFDLLLDLVVGSES